MDSTPSHLTEFAKQFTFKVYNSFNVAGFSNFDCFVIFESVLDEPTNTELSNFRQVCFTV